MRSARTLLLASVPMWLALPLLGCSPEGYGANPDTRGDGVGGGPFLPDAAAADASDGGGKGYWACDPAFELDRDRYEEFEGLEGETLGLALAEFVTQDHDPRGYDPSREFLFEVLEVRDHGELECVYTDARTEPDGTNLPGGEFNTEHTWPRSRGAEGHPQRSDLHHLFAVEIDANNRRANHEFGHVACDELSCNWYRDGSFLGPSSDDARDPVFEVQPERRGDIARAILYFSVRYDEPVSPKEEAVLRAWNCDDPPSEYERERNDAIEAFQGNRNPFIDRPDFVDHIERFDGHGADGADG